MRETYLDHEILVQLATDVVTQAQLPIQQPPCEPLSVRKRLSVVESTKEARPHKLAALLTRDFGEPVWIRTPPWPGGAEVVVEQDTAQILTTEKGEDLTLG